MALHTIRTANEEYRSLFGRKVYKISLSLRPGEGFISTCPNRDGTLGTRGCAFCTGSGEFAEAGVDMEERIRAAIGRVASKLPHSEIAEPGPSFIAYFQDHSNTYAPTGVLRREFEAAIRHPLVCGLSVATRPDCLPDETVALLSELNRIKPVWVELGLQTSNDRTAETFGRGYPGNVFEERAEAIRGSGVRVVTHLILGLPGETEEDMFRSVRYLSGKTDGVKFHMLHILDGTRYGELYREGRISALSFPEYREILTECLRRLDPDITVHRLTGDGPAGTLIAPRWSADKKHVLNALRRHFDSVRLVQGEHLTFEP